jgi:hypothetical protein
MVLRRRGLPEDVALKTAVEVASVKAQVQAIIRRLRSDLDELEHEFGRLPEGEDPDAGLERRGTTGGTEPGDAPKRTQSGTP